MTEYRINARRNWKAETFPYDKFIPDDSPECQYCLTDKQAEILRGIVEPLGWETRWWSDSDSPIVKDEIEAFRDDIIRRLMMSCCGDESPILFRYTSDGVLQRSEDGGTTWTDSPQNDPRNNSTQFPPLPGDDTPDKKCIAATGMVALIKSQVSGNLTDDMSSYTLAQLLHDWVNTVIQTGNPFQALLTIAANQIFALVISALRAALTDDVYDLLLCIFDCNMNNDASFTEAQVEQVRIDIGDQITGLPTLFLQQLVFLLGSVGMTNLARAGGATEGTCDCDCEGCDATWEIGNLGFSPFGVIDSQTSTELIIHNVLHTDGYWYVTLQTTDETQCCEPSSIEVLEGSLTTSWNRIICPNTQNIANMSGGAITGGVGGMNYMANQSATYFKLKLTFP